MGTVALVLAGRLRARWRALIGLVLLVTLAGGATLGALDAASQTSSAFDRMVARNHSYQLLINPDSGEYDHGLYERIKALPSVERAGLAMGTAALLAGDHTLEAVDNAAATMTVLDGAGYAIERPAVRDGRMPDPGRADEAFVDATFAEAHHLRVGDVIQLKVLDGDGTGAAPDQDRLNAFAFGPTDPTSIVPVHVVGIGSGSDSIAVDEGFQPVGMTLTPAFWAEHRQPAIGFWGALVTLKPGANESAFRHQVQAMFGSGSVVVFQTREVTRVKVERAVEPQVRALELFGAVMALVGLLLVGQALVRHLQVDAEDNPALGALGTTRRQRFAVNLSVVTLVAVSGAIGSVLVAVAVSPLSPVGMARLADPHPGFRADWLLLVPAAVGLVLAIVVVTLIPAWRSAAVARRTVRVRPSALAAWMARSGMSPSAVTGVRFAFESDRGRNAVPVRSTMLAVVGAVAVLVTAITFARSLDHFVQSPPLYGADWQAFATGDSTTQDGDVLLRSAGRALDRAPQVTGYGQLLAGEVTLAGRAVPSFAVTTSAKPITGPTIVDGRAPAGPDEVALGIFTLRDLGLRIGDRVPVAAPEGTAGGVAPPGELRVVGRVVLPGVGTYSGSDKTSLGQGAVFTAAGLRKHSSLAYTKGFVVQTRPGVTFTSLERQLHRTIAMPAGVDWWISVGPGDRPSDVVSLARLHRTPLALAGVLVLLMAGTVANALVVAVRRRRRDLAVLGVLGATRRQVMGTVAWQATAIGVVGLAVGMPLGLIAGREAWTALATSLGVVAPPVVPMLELVAVAIGVLLLINLVSLAPGARAARRRPAVALGSE